MLKTKRFLLILTLIIILAFLIRLTYSNSLNFGEDEYHTVFYSQHKADFSDNFKYSTTSFFLYIIFQAWTSIVGISKIMMSLLSILFGLISIIFVYFILREFYSDNRSLVGTLIFSFIPAHIHHSTQIRSHIFALTFGIIAIYFFVKYYNGRKDVFAYLTLIYSAIAFSFVGLYFSLHSALFILLLVCTFKSTSKFRKKLFFIIIIGLLFMLLILPAGLIAKKQADLLTKNRTDLLEVEESYIKLENLYKIQSNNVFLMTGNALIKVISSNIPIKFKIKNLASIVIISLIYLFGFLYYCKSLKKSPNSQLKKYVLLLFILFTGILLCFWFFKYMPLVYFSPRYFFISTVLFSFFMVELIYRIKKTHLKIIFISLLILLFLFLTFQQQTYHKCNTIIYDGVVQLPENYDRMYVESRYYNYFYFNDNPANNIYFPSGKEFIPGIENILDPLVEKNKIFNKDICEKKNGELVYFYIKPKNTILTECKLKQLSETCMNFFGTSPNADILYVLE